jgi:hypothetical protein
MLKPHPQWDPLRGDPRFEAIVVSLAPKAFLHFAGDPAARAPLPNPLDSISSAPRAFFAIPRAFFFWKVMKTTSFNPNHKT